MSDWSGHFQASKRGLATKSSDAGKEDKKMRKYKLFLSAVFALFLFGAMTAAPSFATFQLAQWLVNGSRIAAALGAEFSLSRLLENSILLVGMVCSYIEIGTIGPESLDLVTEILNLTLEKIGELTGLALLCLGEANCIAEEDAEAQPVGLPWLTEVELETSTGAFVELYFGMGWHEKCLVLGVNFEEECTAAEGFGFEDLNVAGGVEEMGEDEEKGKCAGEEHNYVEVTQEGSLLTSEGGTISVSE
jgi:hypothetical protein